MKLRLFFFLSVLCSALLPATHAGILEDRAIEDAVANSFVFRQVLIDPSMVQLYVRYGKAELRGQVSDERERALLTYTISAIPNVTQVENYLFVDSATRRDADRWRAQRQRALLLMEGDLDIDRTRVELIDGQWRLAGEVGSEAQLELIRARVAAASPTAPVPLVLTLAPVPAAALNVDDASVAALVRSRLETDAAVTLRDAAITCVRGVVTLSGSVASPTELQTAARVAGTVRGARQVENRLTVRP